VERLSVSTFQNYVVCFSDGRIKIGMTSNFSKRMSYYRREARKSGTSQVTWWAATAFAEKPASLLMERLICNSYKHLAFAGAREWIKGGAEVYSAIIKQSEFVRELMAGGRIEKQESWGFWSESGRVGDPA
jgi:hypothetical protein